MDFLYNCATNDLISIEEQLLLLQSELQLSDGTPLPTNDEDIKQLLGIENDDEFEQLAKSVDLLENLSQPDDERVLPHKPGIDQHRKPLVEVPKQALHLNTFREVVTYKKKFVGNPFGSSAYNNKIMEINERLPDECDLKPYEDVLISIRFYQPFRYNVATVAGLKFSKEFIVRGEQFLSELRDKVPCECTNRPLYDISEDPDQEAPEIDSDPGFFFITDTFYNDLRNPKNHDYSSVILKWAALRKPGTFSSEFKSARMENTKFIDLNVRIGFPQVYQHFGNCEHLFTFSWIRVMQPNDHLASIDYPIIRSMHFKTTMICNICAVTPYTFTVTDSDRHMHSPVYLCRRCFYSFHYVDGKKVGNFKAYLQNPNVSNEYPSSDDDEDDNEGVDSDAKDWKEKGP